jgi:hypothetical protein
MPKRPSHLSLQLPDDADYKNTTQLLVVQLFTEELGVCVRTFYTVLPTVVFSNCVFLS